MVRVYIPVEVAQAVRAAAKNRCGYCLSPQHLERTSGPDPQGGKVIELFDPRRQKWTEHFRWSDDGLRVIGLTPTGRATVALLHLDDDPDAVVVRGFWVMAGWHPPRD